MLYPSCVALMSSSLALFASVHTSPGHWFRHRNFVSILNMSTCPSSMHMKYLVILSRHFQMAVILVLFIDLLWTVMETSYCIHLCTSSLLIYVVRRRGRLAPRQPLSVCALLPAYEENRHLRPLGNLGHRLRRPRWID